MTIVGASVLSGWGPVGSQSIYTAYGQVLVSFLVAKVMADVPAALLSMYVMDGHGVRVGHRWHNFVRDGRCVAGQCSLD